MSWINQDAVSVVLQTDLSGDLWIDQLIDHAQHLAELEIGDQSTPNNRLKAVLTDIVARMWQAGQSAKRNPAGLDQQTTGPFGYSDRDAGVAGLGLTNREKADLRRAAGIGGLFVQPTTRDSIETAPAGITQDNDELDPIERLVTVQQDLYRP